ncbi:MAG: flagellar basal body L-ring protein [Gammaproteobacteria bacterium 39-13]|nr:flagellar basal body L-ring protein FlgH [Gammaproteobacteria bacterium]OJV86605.1 MAG: flagellar basal body L-ring protein [Gammaproteobacteria bacterium 39-13]
MLKRIISLSSVLICTLLTGCIHIDVPNDPDYAPVFPDPAPIQTPDTGSIYYPKEGMALFEDIKAHKVGDVLTVVLAENTNANKTANSQYEKKNQITLPEPEIFHTEAKWKFPKQLPIPLVTTDNLGLETNINGDTKFTGTGTATQNNQLTGTISVVVTKIYPNGNLFVRGEKWVHINQGDEFIRLAGIVRVQDINPDNTISSNRLADARITYSGKGAFANGSNPGWLVKILSHPWWPI